MLWTLLKIVIFVSLIGLVVLGAQWLLNVAPEEYALRLVINGVERTIPLLEAAVGLSLLFIGFWLVLKLAALVVASWRFLAGDETAISRYFDRTREKRGFKALSDGMVALASGDTKTALTKVNKADKLLEQHELADILRAQTAEAAGDQRLAEKSYKKLIANDKTRFIGVHGAMRARLEAGDEDTALKLAEKALALKPKHEEIQDTLLQLQAKRGDYEGARRTLAAKRKSGKLPRDVYARRDAVLALSTAQGIFEDGASIDAREKAIEANRLSPDLIPAAVMAAKGYMAQNKPRYATRLLVKAWDVQPHPDLAAAFAEIVPDETPAARLKRFRQLTKRSAPHSESKMLMAELEIAAENFPEARRIMGDWPEDEITVRVATIMAAVAKGEGMADEVVRGWLAKAVTAPRGPQWVCENCSNVAAFWAPTCASCGAFDTLGWKDAPATELVLPGGTEMLPLLIGGGTTKEQADDDTNAGEEPNNGADIVDGEVITAERSTA